MAGLWIWLAAVLFYLAFRVWYDNWRGPLRREEIDAYLEDRNFKLRFREPAE